jgi:Pyridoxamine 5'-phosphate oxidase.
MAILTNEIKDALKVVGKGGSVVHLATSSVDGKTNIVAERFVTSYLDDYILIADMFAQKTKVNLNENPQAAISIAHPIGERSWVFRGPATVINIGAPSTENWYDVNYGEVLDEWGDWVAKEPPVEVPPDIAPPKVAQRGLIVLKVEEIISSKLQNSGEIL